jgi:hypothetical protein
MSFSLYRELCHKKIKERSNPEVSPVSESFQNHEGSIFLHDLEGIVPPLSENEMTKRSKQEKNEPYP